jgi:hypothetical protein
MHKAKRVPGAFGGFAETAKSLLHNDLQQAKVWRLPAATQEPLTTVVR